MRRVLFAVVAVMLFVPGWAAAQEGTPVPNPRAVIDGQWEVTFLRLYHDIRELDPSAEWFTGWVDQNPAPEGSRYFALQVRIKNVGTEAGNPYGALSFILVTPTGFEYEGGCGTVPGGMDFTTQLDVGDQIDANLCWVVQDRHINGLSLRVAPSFSTDDTEAVTFGLFNESGTPVP